MSKETQTWVKQENLIGFCIPERKMMSKMSNSFFENSQSTRSGPSNDTLLGFRHF